MIFNIPAAILFPFTTYIYGFAIERLVKSASLLEILNLTDFYFI